MKKLTFTLLLTLMAIFSAQAAKVYLKIGEGRVTAESNLAVWVWEGKNNFCTNKEWPGDKLTEKYGAQNEAYMSRSAEKWVRGLCFNELDVCG